MPEACGRQSRRAKAGTDGTCLLFFEYGKRDGKQKKKIRATWQAERNHVCPVRASRIEQGQLYDYLCPVPQKVFVKNLETGQPAPLYIG